MNKQLLYFTAQWCGPCRQFAPVISELSAEYPIDKIDIDQSPSMAERYNIRSIPTLVLVDGEGNEVLRKSGVISKQAIKELFR